MLENVGLVGAHARTDAVTQGLFINSGLFLHLLNNGLFGWEIAAGFSGRNSDVKRFSDGGLHSVLSFELQV